MSAQPSGPPVHADQESADLFDYALIRDWLIFVLSSVRRHKVLVSGILASILALAIVGMIVLPKTYKVETHILAQRNQVMAALGNPGRTIPGDADAPTRAASETILNHDNLVALVQQTNLLSRWDAERAPALRLKDLVMRLFRKPDTEEDKREALVAVLEKKLVVTSTEGSVTISLEWPSAQTCYRIVEAAQQNFLEARHVAEISTIAEAISILEGHAAGVRESIETEMEELQRLRDARSGKPRPAAIARPRPAQSAETLQLRLMLTAKRKAIGDLEDFRRRRLSELQVDLAKEKAIYAEQHPLVLNTEQMIESLHVDSPQITELRKEENDLRQEYLRRGGKLSDLDRETSAPLRNEGPGRAIPAEPPPRPGDLDDETAAYTKSRIDFATAKYNGLLDRIDSARIELDTARAAFKYRYSVIRPPQVPKKPIKPNQALVIIGALVGGLVIAFVVATAIDVNSGTIYERWQVERELQIPILTQMGPQ